MTKILVVDDDRMLRTLLVSQLGKQGFEVESAEDGEHALQLLKTLDVDLVILDLQMPGIDGFEVCENLRAKRDIPVIFQTGTNDSIILNHITSMSASVGGNYFLGKPIDIKVLTKLINEVLELQPSES